MRSLVLSPCLTHGNPKEFGELFHGGKARVLGSPVADLANLHDRHSNGIGNVGKVGRVQFRTNAVHEFDGFLCHGREDTKKNLQETLVYTNSYLYLCTIQANKMKPFTKLQREEILNRIDTREETVTEDPESGDAFELTEGALEALRAKVKAGVMEFTKSEGEWMVSEFENMVGIGWSNMSSEGPEKVNGYIGSMNNGVRKSKK